MPHAVVRYFSAANAVALENLLDQYAHNNPNWEIVSASHQLIPGGISVVIVIKQLIQPVSGNPPTFAT